ncbi:MAG TPA: DMT family transporter [Micropepsaceae bacterium]|jgi:O-acetylserine/cysteine efflux transporter|nr:DMT family transporter [Micropepsaceae bacterium]
MRFNHFLMAMLVCVVWGLNAVAGKIGVTYIPPVFFTALRFVFVLACVAPWLKPVPGKWKVLIPAVFFMGGLHFALIFSGVKLSDASTMSIVNQLYVPISVLLAMIWLDESVPLRRWLGIALAFCGVIVFSLDASVASHWMGVLLLFLDAISMGIGTVLLRRLSGVPPFVMQAWMAVLGIPFLLATSVVFETGQMEALGSAPWQAWTALAYSVLAGSLIGHTFYYVLLQHYEVSLVGSVLLLGPAIGVLSGVVFLHEPFTPMIVVGAAMTLMGVAIVLRRTPLRRLEPAQGV